MPLPCILKKERVQAPSGQPGLTLFSSSYAQEEEEGRRVLPASLAAFEIAFHGVEVLGTP